MEQLETRYHPSSFMTIEGCSSVSIISIEPPPILDVDWDLLSATFANIPEGRVFSALLDNKYLITSEMLGSIRVLVISTGEGWMTADSGGLWQAVKPSLEMGASVLSDADAALLVDLLKLEKVM